MNSFKPQINTDETRIREGFGIQGSDICVNLCSPVAFRISEHLLARRKVRFSAPGKASVITLARVISTPQLKSCKIDTTEFYRARSRQCRSFRASAGTRRMLSL